MSRLYAAALLFALAAPALAQNCSAPVPGNITASVHFKAVSDYLDSIADDLWPLNKEIHDNPELGYEEVEAHDLLTSFMESQDGWNVTRSLGGFDTAFMAVFEGSGGGPVISFNAEYGAYIRGKPSAEIPN